MKKQIQKALISVFHKEGLGPIVDELHSAGVDIYSTGGTQDFIEKRGIPVIPVEDITQYPAILGGRVKTLHPKIFGGILNRQDVDSDQQTLQEFEIPQLDLVIVDLYPFEDTVAQGGTEAEIVEKIDIGGIALIRAAAKNFKDVLCVSNRGQYDELLELIQKDKGSTSLDTRQKFAVQGFATSSHYDTAIFNHFNQTESYLKLSDHRTRSLRYGENPHQEGRFFGPFEDMLEQLHGKELSYNNLLDVDAAVSLMEEFTNSDPTFAILKHNNACGLATRNSLAEAYADALSGDPVSAFGGVLIANRPIDMATANQVHELFCEVVIAPDFEADALELLKQKKNRILLKIKTYDRPTTQVRSCLNGVLVQERDLATDQESDLQAVTNRKAEASEISDLLFASKICKHTKSNTIVLVKNNQLLASGTGQTSRVDALQQAIAKAQHFKFSLAGAVMASDAFFPFPDCVEIAHNAGVQAVIQPGGSIKDQLSIDYCDENNMAMVFTGTRHFKH